MLISEELFDKVINNTDQSQLPVFLMGLVASYVFEKLHRDETGISLSAEDDQLALERMEKIIHLYGIKRGVDYFASVRRILYK